MSLEGAALLCNSKSKFCSEDIALSVVYEDQLVRSFGSNSLATGSNPPVASSKSEWLSPQCTVKVKSVKTVRGSQLIVVVV